MGLRPKEAPPSYNELEWWAAYRSFIPTITDKIDHYAARSLGLHANKAPIDVRTDWFNPLHDPDIKKKLMQELEEEAEENRKKYEEEKRLKAEAEGKCQK